MAAPKRALLFDLDGTLVDTERETGEALARALARGQGIAIERYDRDFVIGRSWVAIHDSLRSRYPRLAWTREQLVAEVAMVRAGVLEQLGVTVLPGARTVLGWTKRYPRALVTGSSRVEVTQVLPFLGPDAAFDAIVSSEDVPRSKPAPDGYLAAAAAIRCSPADCIVIEDSQSGIAAAKAAGCVVLAVRAGNSGGWDQSGADHIIDTLELLTPSLLDELAAITPRDYGSGMGSVS
ncbi:MAG: HAD family hydrolase [Kofleriaceae bacterium]